MKKRLFCTACLACAAMSAAATPETWKFSYSNLIQHNDLNNGDVVWENYPTSIIGSFTGEDRNGDHLLTADELSSLKINIWGGPGFGSDMFPLGEPPDEAPGWSWSTLNAFTYDFGQQLDIVGTKGWFKESWSIDTTQPTAHYFESGGSGQGVTTWNWTSATALTIAPIPEPSSTGLMGLGLLGVALAAKGRRTSPAHRIANASPAAR